MTLELNGYHAVIPHKIYAKETTVERNRMLVPQTNLILLKRHTTPTKEQAFAYLQEQLRESFREAKSKEQSARSNLEAMVLTLKQPLQGAVLKDNSRIAKFLKQQISTIVGDAGSEYQSIDILYISILSETIRKAKTHTLDQQWYESFLMRDYQSCGEGKLWIATIVLDGCRLPEKSEMDILLKNQTITSKPLLIDCRPACYAQVTDAVEALYAGFSDPEAISKIEDISEQLMESIMFRAIDSLINAAARPY